MNYPKQTRTKIYKYANEDKIFDLKPEHNPNGTRTPPLSETV